MPALSVVCRYDVELDDRCGAGGSPEAASTTGAQHLLVLAATNAAPLLCNAGKSATADDAPMAEWDPNPATSSWRGAPWWSQWWSQQSAKQKWRPEDYFYKKWGEPAASSRDTSNESSKTAGQSKAIDKRARRSANAP